MNKRKIAILQTVILLLDNVKESDIMLKYDLAPHLKKAKEVLTILE